LRLLKPILIKKKKSKNVLVKCKGQENGLNNHLKKDYSVREKMEIVKELTNGTCNEAFLQIFF